VAKLGRRGDAIPSRDYHTSSEDDTDTDIDRRDADKPVAAVASGYGHSTSPNPIQRRKHLYVVLDDWKKGFSIHKLDLDNQWRSQAPGNRGLGLGRGGNFVCLL
jgi:hypothetical protein